MTDPVSGDSIPAGSVPASKVTSGRVEAVGKFAVGRSKGKPFAVSRRCRHLGADLAKGKVSGDGCLVCPWHGAEYDVRSGRMVKGPQGIFAKVPGLGAMFKALTRVAPLRTRTVVKDGKNLRVQD